MKNIKSLKTMTFNSLIKLANIVQLSDNDDFVSKINKDLEDVSNTIYHTPFSFDKIIHYNSKKQINKLLFDSCENCDYDGVVFALEKGASINDQIGGSQYTPLIIAVINDCYDIVKLLIQRGANVNIEDSNGIIAIDHTNNYSIIKIL